MLVVWKIVDSFPAIPRFLFFPHKLEIAFHFISFLSLPPPPSFICIH